MAEDVREGSEATATATGPSELLGNGGHPRKISNMLEERCRARERKDWAEADRLKSEIESEGFELTDLKDGTTTVRLLSEVRAARNAKSANARRAQRLAAYSLSSTHGLDLVGGESELATIPRSRLSRNRKRRRHQQRQKGRFQAFADFVESTFFPGRSLRGASIVDVAGGAGALAHELGVVRGASVLVVDPKGLSLSSGKTRELARSASKGEEGAEDTCAEVRSSSSSSSSSPVAAAMAAATAAAAGIRIPSPLSAAEETDAEPQSMFTAFNEPTSDWLHAESSRALSEDDVQRALEGLRNLREARECFDREFAASKLWRGGGGGGDVQDEEGSGRGPLFSVVLGLHPDEATDAIVEECVERRQPFAVVPCCVFPSRNAGRRVRFEGEGERPVTTREELCLFLQQKDALNIRVARVEAIPGPCNDVVFATYRHSAEAERERDDALSQQEIETIVGKRERE